jgi:hypothetical protein
MSLSLIPNDVWRSGRINIHLAKKKKKKKKEKGVLKKVSPE